MDRKTGLRIGAKSECTAVQIVVKILGIRDSGKNRLSVQAEHLKMQRSTDNLTVGELFDINFGRHKTYDRKY